MICFIDTFIFEKNLNLNEQAYLTDQCKKELCVYVRHITKYAKTAHLHDLQKVIVLKCNDKIFFYFLTQYQLITCILKDWIKTDY